MPDLKDGHVIIVTLGIRTSWKVNMPLTGDEDGIVFNCNLKDGRYFITHSNN